MGKARQRVEGKEEIVLTLSTHRTSAFALRIIQPAVDAVFVESVRAYSCN